MNKISIIVPVYNIKEYIGRCTESVVGQSYTDLEIIIVDDGSDDGSDVVIDELSKRDDRIRVLHNTHRGALQARLTGAKAATGEWIAFIDGDDIIEPEMYERLLYNAIKYHADISHCGYEIVNINGHSVKYYDSCNIQVQEPMDVLNVFAKSEREDWWSLCTKIYKRQLFTADYFNAIADLQVASNEDLLMNYLLVRDADKLVYEDKCWYRYMKRINSATDIDSTSKRLDRIMVRRLMRDWAPKPLYEEHEKTYLQMCVSEYRDLCCEKEPEEVLGKVWKLLASEIEYFYLLDDKRTLMADLIINYEGIFKTLVSNGELESFLQKITFMKRGQEIE